MATLIKFVCWLCFLHLGTSASSSYTSSILGHITSKPKLGSIRASSEQRKSVFGAFKLRGGTQESDLESAMLRVEQNKNRTCNQSSKDIENVCFGDSSSKMLPQKPPFTLWQALFQPELLSRASAEKADAELRSPPPEAMDIFLIPLAFLPGGVSCLLTLECKNLALYSKANLLQSQLIVQLIAHVAGQELSVLLRGKEWYRCGLR
jgi:hypothetical protein